MTRFQRKYFDLGFLMILGTLSIISVVRHFVDGYILTVNLYLGMVCCVTCLLLEIIANKRSKAFLLSLISLSAFNIVSFTVENFAFGSSAIHHYGAIYFALPGVNPVFLVVLVAYLLMDSSFAMSFYKIFGPSDNEIEEEYKKQARFYYERFSACNKKDLDFAIKNLKDYPRPAQDALEIVVAKRKEDGKNIGTI